MYANSIFKSILHLQNTLPNVLSDCIQTSNLHPKTPTLFPRSYLIPTKNKIIPTKLYDDYTQLHTHSNVCTMFSRQSASTKPPMMYSLYVVSSCFGQHRCRRGRIEQPNKNDKNVYCPPKDVWRVC